MAISAGSAEAAAPTSSAVTLPAGGNYGSTSYFDGFGRTTEGFSSLTYGRYEDLTKITDANGDKVPVFSGTHLSIFVLLEQISYTSNWHPFGGDGVGFSIATPIADLNTHFAPGSIVRLHPDGFNIGDTVFGPIYQSKFYRDDKGRPRFAWRFQFIVLAPTGGLDKKVAVNQGAGQWAVNPYISFTVLPTPRWEISTRFNYQYNFTTSDLQAPVSPTYHNGQSGQVIYDNFDTSYRILPRTYLGFNGYFIDQLSPNKTNGQVVPKSRESEVYVGPGGRFAFNAANALNVNLYFPVEYANATVGTIFNFQFVHRF
jgi:hypothetical protein